MASFMASFNDATVQNNS